jgi:wobble nucleotide-excising tRNase
VRVGNTNRKLEKLNSSLVDIKYTEQFGKRNKLSELVLLHPALNMGCFTVDVEQLSKEAQEKVEIHIENSLKERDTSWLENGLNLVTEDMKCPFCAQPLSESPIFHLYQEFINESYLMASDKFELASGEFELEVSSIGVVLEELEEVVKNNQETIREWSDRIESIELVYDFKESRNLFWLIEVECRRLIKSKEKDLLTPVDLTQFNSLVEQFFEHIDFSDYNLLVKQFNESISDFLLGLGAATSQSIQTQIDSIKESKERYKANLLSDLEAYDNIDKDKINNTREINELRNEITKEQGKSIGRHKDSINELLKNFNSMIRIGMLEKDNKGNRGATRITYVITFVDSQLSVLVDDKKIFNRILSAGDKSALALSFFLSKYKEKNFDESILVLDDPISSLDIHRKDATIGEVEKLVNNGYQTFVLSHDPFFLSEVLKRSILSKDTKCYEIDAFYKDTNPYDDDSAQYISSKLVHRNNFESYVLHSYTQEYNKLKDFVVSATEDEKAEVARSIRPILEAYLRFILPSTFLPNDWIGGMIKKIRNENDRNSACYDRDDRLSSIQKINEYSKSFHHADGFDTKIQSLDILTVKNYAKETLKFITGL